MQLGVRIRDLTRLPVEIDYEVHETNGKVEYLGDTLAPCHLGYVVAPDNPLSQVGGLRGGHGRAG